VQAVAQPVFFERNAGVEELTKNRISTIIRRSILSHYAAKTFGLNKFFDLNRLA
jgi:hypothetical protein